VNGDVICLAALYLVLWVVLGRVMRISFVIKIFGMHLYDSATYASGLGVPGHTISDFEFF